jgi:hypothetical protein
LGDREIKLIQLRDLILGKLGVAGERFQQASRPGCIDLFEQLQIDDAEPIAFGEQAVTSGVRDFFDQSLGAQLRELVAEGAEFVLIHGAAESLRRIEMYFPGREDTSGRQVREAHQGLHERQLARVIDFESGDPLEWSPGVRQTVKTLPAVRWNCIVLRTGFPGKCAAAGEAEAGSAGEQPAEE